MPKPTTAYRTNGMLDDVTAKQGNHSISFAVASNSYVLKIAINELSLEC